MRAFLRRMLGFTFTPEREWQAAHRAIRPGVARYLAILALWPAAVAALLTVTRDGVLAASWLTPLASGSPYALELGGAFALPAVPLSSIAERASPLVTTAVPVLTYLGTWLAVGFGALVLRLLAPVFDGRGDLRLCMAVTGYSATPLILSSAALLNPSLAPVIALAAMHACYVAYLGIPTVLHVRRSDAGVCIAIAVLLSLVLSQIAGYGAGALASALRG